jgi:hypothetical protein
MVVLAGPACESPPRQRLFLGPKFNVGVSNGLECELPLTKGPSSDSASLFVMVGGGYEATDYQTDPSDPLSDVDADLTRMECTVGVRLSPTNGADEYFSAFVSAVRLDWQVDTYGSSSGTAAGFGAAVGYRCRTPHADVLRFNVEAGVCFWRIPEMDIVDGGGDVAEYAETRLPLRPIRLHVAFGVHYRF